MARGGDGVKFDDDIWPQVKQHTWKYRPRYDGPITLIELHSTRGGVPGHTAAQEYQSTINWFTSPNNVQDNGRWGACSSVIIGGGRICRVMPDEFWPSFCLGHADPVGLAIEIGQTSDATPFDPRDLELAAQYCAEKSIEYSIPARILRYLSVDNHEAPGYVRHDRSANGDVYGKSDPGMLFNNTAFETRVRALMAPPQEDSMHYRLVSTGLYTFLVAQDRDKKAPPIWKRYLGPGEPLALYVAAYGPVEHAAPGSLAWTPQL